MYNVDQFAHLFGISRSKAWRQVGHYEKHRRVLPRDEHGQALLSEQDMTTIQTVSELVASGITRSYKETYEMFEKAEEKPKGLQRVAHATAPSPYRFN